MGYRLLADLVVVVHGGFVLFAVLGGFLVLWRSRWLWVHLPAVLWATYVELSGGVCPLTPLEDLLRALAGQEAHGGDFVGRYLTPLLYPKALTRGRQILLGSLVLILNGAVYLAAWRRKRGRFVHRQGKSRTV